MLVHSNQKVCNSVGYCTIISWKAEEMKKSGFWVRVWIFFKKSVGKQGFLKNKTKQTNKAPNPSGTHGTTSPKKSGNPTSFMEGGHFIWNSPISGVSLCECY